MKDSNMDFDLLGRALFLINDYCYHEFGEPADFSDLSNIGVGFTTTEEENLPVQIIIDLPKLSLYRYLNTDLIERKRYDSLREFVDNELEYLCFDDLIYFDDEVIKEYLKG